MKKTVVFLDYLRVIAVLAVVLLHTFSLALFQYEPGISFNWWVGNVVASTTHWAVPVFIMISGALHLGKPLGKPLHFYLKKIKRILIPLVFFIFFFGWSEQNVFYQLIFDEPFKHLYFLIVLLILFLITPALNYYLIKYPKKILIFFFFTLLYTLFIRPTRFIGLFWIPFLSYYLAGFFLIRFQKKFRTLCLVFFTILLFVLTMIGTTLFTTHLIPNSDGFYWFGISSPLTVLLSCSIFVLAKQISPHVNKSKSISFLSQTVFGIYLIHPFFLILTEKIYPAQIQPYLIERLLIFFMTTVTSFVSVYAYQEMTRLIKNSSSKRHLSASEEE